MRALLLAILVLACDSTTAPPVVSNAGHISHTRWECPLDATGPAACFATVPLALNDTLKVGYVYVFRDIVQNIAIVDVRLAWLPTPTEYCPPSSIDPDGKCFVQEAFSLNPLALDSVRIALLFPRANLYEYGLVGYDGVAVVFRKTFPLVVVADSTASPGVDP